MSEKSGNQALWSAVDDYISDLLIPPDLALDAALEANAAAGLPAISVSPPQGKLLHLLARLHRARSILEIGTLGGYSTIWLARALPPSGRLVTLEADPKHADVARNNIARAGLAHVVDLRLGAALDTLPVLAHEEHARFDFIFIDADKPNNPEYFAWALRLSHPRSVIVVDNVIRNGEIIDANSHSETIQANRRLFEIMATEPRVSASAIQMVGIKGYDGFAIALVTEGRDESPSR